MLVLRRYVLPLILSTVIYLLLAFVFSPKEGYFIAGCFFTVMLSYLMRICDDISDLQKDIEKGKALLGKRSLWWIFAGIVASILTGVIFWQVYIVLLPLCLILLQFLFRGRLRTVLKLTFLPSILTALFFSCFEFSYFLFALIAISVIADLILIFIKGDNK